MRVWHLFVLLSTLLCAVNASGGCCNYDCRCVQPHGSQNFCQEWSCDVRVDPCFPATSILNGVDKPMSDLQVGDKAMSPIVDEDKVHNWIHREAEVISEFLKIETDDGALEVSPEHLIYLNDRYQFAKNAQPGDKLHKKESTVTVRAITTFHSRGVYAPLTASGEMYVDGFRVSCYAYYESHAISHLLMKPLLFLSEAKDTIHWYPKLIKSIYDFVSNK